MSATLGEPGATDGVEAPPAIHTPAAAVIAPSHPCAEPVVRAAALDAPA